MGRVVEALDVALDRTVALKEILEDSEEARRRFAHEVAITARLEHPGIVPLYDAGVGANGAPFYVMRKVTGEPLDVLIRARATLDRRLALLPHLLAACDAVAHAHGRGVVHRDLKPSNVLVGELGETIVIDWGLAQAVGDGDGGVAGTPGFMAPERDVDERSDVYALGACLYMLLAGTPPRGCALPRGVPPELAAIVAKAMAPAREARYLDAGGVSEELRRFLAGQLIAAHRYPVRARVARWVRRNRTAFAVGSVAVVALAVVGAVAVGRIVRAQAAEHARAEELIAAQAGFFLEADPTLGAASLQQLADDSPRWRELGPLVDDLRARGVAYGLPSPGGAVQLDLDASRDRALVSSRGTVLLLDLRARTATTLASGDVWSAHWRDGRAVIDATPPARVAGPARLVAPRRIEIAGRTVIAPEDVTVVAAGGCCLVAAGPARVLVWRLDEILPRHVAIPHGGTVSFAGERDVVVAAEDDAVRVGGAREALTPPTEVRGDVAIRPDSIRFGACTARVIGTTAIVQLDARTVVAGTASGTIVRIADCRIDELARMPAAISALAAHGPWLAARAGDGTLWRRGPLGEERGRAEGAGDVALGADGVAFVDSARDLAAWVPGAAPERFARLARPIDHLVAVTPRAVGLRAAGALVRIDRRLRAPLVMVPRLGLLSRAVGARVAATGGGELLVADIDVGATFAVSTLAIDPESVALAPDGAVVAVVWPGTAPSLDLWQLRTGAPQDWIRRATNAGVPATARSAIPWR